jgi:hypothetical protein
MAAAFGIDRLRMRCVVLVLLLGASACSTPPAEPGKGADSVCPTCRRTVGGETGDFGAGGVACGYRQRNVDEKEAEALGFSIAVLARVMRQPIDAAMTWTPIDTAGGGPARGYESKTRVVGALARESYAYHELDIDGCDEIYPQADANKGCRESTVDPSACMERFLTVNASGDLHTHDGAIAADLPMQIVSLLFPDDESVGELSFAARADLRDVRGSLELDPSIPEPRVGFLDLSLSYTLKGKLNYGAIDISIYPDWDKLQTDAGVPIDSGLKLPEQSQYHPLEGGWGSPPPLSGAEVGAPPAP